MGKPRYRWWGYVKSVIRAYPEFKKELEELRLQSVTAAYGPVSGHSGTGRPVERAAMKQLSPADQREYEAVTAAMKETARLPDGQERLKIMDLVFFRQSHTLQGAAMAAHLSYRSARRRQNDFILLVAQNLELL